MGYVFYSARKLIVYYHRSWANVIHEVQASYIASTSNLRILHSSHYLGFQVYYPFRVLKCTTFIIFFFKNTLLLLYIKSTYQNNNMTYLKIVQFENQDNKKSTIVKFMYIKQIKTVVIRLLGFVFFLNTDIITGNASQRLLRWNGYNVMKNMGHELQFL